jgi:predicted DsbA family dithiol-disulfide isomerase/uncharacterized membrane protein
LLTLRGALCIGLAASAALAVDYRSAGSAFCGPESGCAALRQTDLAYLWGIGITLPELGLFGLAVAFALTLLRDATWGARLAVLAGAAGLALLALQVVLLETYCWLCVTTDVSSVIAGAFGLVALKKPRTADDRAPMRLTAWIALPLVAVVATALWPRLKPAPAVPAEIQGFYVPGKINVIEFADFECPFCRALHGELKSLYAPYGERIHVVRLNVPLERHPQALPAALAAVCSEPSGKSAEFSEFLFSTEDLSQAAIDQHAQSLGIDLAAFRSCLESRAARARVEREKALLKAIGFEGLPTTYVGSTRIVGAQAREVFRDALELAAENGGNHGVPAWAYALIVLAILAAVVRMGWSKGEAAATSSRQPSAA